MTNAPSSAVAGLELALEVRTPHCVLDALDLIALGDAIGLDHERFVQALIDPATQAELLRQIEFAARLGARGFPSLFLEDERATGRSPSTTTIRR